MVRVIAAVLLMLTRTVAGADTENCDDNVCIKVQGQSGSFDVYSAASKEDDNNTVRIKMSSISEVDSDGAAVLNTGKADDKHSFNNFAQLDFEIKSPTSATIDNVTYSKISFIATIGSVGTMQIDTLIVKSAGNAGPDGEWTVSPGDVKWNIVIPSWNWCGTGDGELDCGGKTGTHIDFDVEIKGSADAPAESGGSSFDLGGVKLQLTDLVTVTDAAGAESNVQMPEGYPKMTLQGSKNIFQFRFPKGKTITYDPLLTSSSTDTTASLAIHRFAHNALYLVGLGAMLFQ